ncbi:hypothetical protein IEO21_10824 [Rhodonia placenta]|uniref:Uncharacterized protein n=1 Tax=Rhodonia placenta TaxID=104341 RepID=A0A8H7TVT4_9APHY|nr:hypothetical protein IEO21_10824 [Postia placenta]
MQAGPHTGQLYYRCSMRVAPIIRGGVEVEISAHGPRRRSRGLLLSRSGAQYVAHLGCETEQQRAACHHSACPAGKRWGIKRSPDRAGTRGSLTTDLCTPVHHSSIDQSLDGVGVWRHSSVGGRLHMSAAPQFD